MGIDNRTALHCAVDGKQIEAIKLLLKYKAKVDMVTISKRTPLHVACIHGFTKIAQILLNFGANINSQDQILNTPCHYCSEYGNFSYITYFRPQKITANSLGKKCRYRTQK